MAYTRLMKRSTNGFTIVELLVAIVAIAILASIVIVSYGGIQARASNVARWTQVQQWRKIFKIYQAHYGSFPNVPNGSYCLGSGFPSGGYCREYWAGAVGPKTYKESDPNNVLLINELKKVATNLPTINPKPVKNAIVGPYIFYWGDGFTLTQAFEGGPSDCPGDMIYTWDDGKGVLLCEVQVRETD